MKKLFKITTFIMISMIFLSSSILAQGQVGETNFNIDDRFGLQEIRIPFFGQLTLGLDQYATAFSWLSFAGAVATVGIIGFWVFLILRASFNALRSSGEEEKLAESFKKLKSVFIGAGITILFPVVISIVGWILGLGPIWNWPTAFRSCPGGAESDFFYQEVLRQSNSESVVDPVSTAESVCYGGLQG